MFKIAITALSFIALLSASEVSVPKNSKEIVTEPNVKECQLGLCQQEICVANIADVNRKGCCSRHGGVCGCEGKRMKCCDNTLSPSCKCGE